MGRIEWYRSANRALGVSNLVSLQLSKYAGQLGVELKSAVLISFIPWS